MRREKETVALYCNPGSGHGKHNTETLRKQIARAGFACRVLPRGKRQAGQLRNADIFAVAGGDGTVRKFVLQLLQAPLGVIRPIGLLPLGTANNIAATLEIDREQARGAMLAAWKSSSRKPFDIGYAAGRNREAFFLESMGYGIFPKLIRGMKRHPDAQAHTPEEEFDAAFRMLSGIAGAYEGAACDLVIDGKDHSGTYLMVELMNIRLLGSNMVIAPKANPGDGCMDVVLVPPAGRDRLLQYLEKAREKRNVAFPFPAIRAREVLLRWKGKDMHVDDEVVSPGKGLLKVRMLQQLLHFL